MCCTMLQGWNRRTSETDSEKHAHSRKAHRIRQGVGDQCALRRCVNNPSGGRDRDNAQADDGIMAGLASDKLVAGALGEGSSAACCASLAVAVAAAEAAAFAGPAAAAASAWPGLQYLPAPSVGGCTGKAAAGAAAAAADDADRL